MSRSTYVYTAMRGSLLVVACTVKYEFISRVRQAIDKDMLQVGNFVLQRTPDNGIPGNGAIITDQFTWGKI